MKPNGLELYIHIPFCVRKCAYCDFLSFPADEDTIQRYVDAVCSEIAIAGENNKKDAETVFFGGGTPSLLSFTQFEQIILALRSSFHITDDAEITVECNPGTVDEEKMTAMRSLGVNRISFGLQSADPDELSMLGRIHTWHEFEESFICARKTGFKNINVDLMLGLPVRDPAKAGKRSHLKETIEKVLQLDPEHISAYSLIVEEETPLALHIREGLLSMPGDEADRRQYRSAVRLLKSYGYEQYEISNFARPGFACRHNEGYWTGAEYLGIGLGASGYYQGVRYRNTKNMEVYLNQMQHVTSSAGFAPAARDYHEVSEKEQIEVYDTEGKKLFSQGRDFVQPLSMTFHGRRLYVLYEDYLVCEYDSASGELLRTISAKTSFSPTKSQHRWDFTDDGQLILTMGNVIAQIDLKLGGMIAEVRSDAGYMPASDRFFVVNGQYSETDPNAFFSYNRYTVDDMIRKGKELVGDMELTEAQRRSFALD